MNPLPLLLTHSRLLLFHSTAKDLGVDAKAEAKLPAGPRADAKKAASKEEDSDEEEDNEDDVAELKPLPASRHSGKEGRRISVSAESLDPTKLKAQRKRILSYLLYPIRI